MRPPENIKAGGGWSPQIYISSHTGMDLQISYSMCFCTAWTPSPVSLWHTLVMGNSCLLASSESNNSLYIMKGNLPSWCYLITWWYHSEHICSLCPQTACRPLKTVTRSLSFPTRSSPSTSLSGMVLVSFPPAWPLWDPSSLTINLRAVILKLNGEIHYKKYILYHDPVYI